MISTKFDERIPYYLTIATICSFLLSLFLLQVFAGLLFISYLFEKWENKKNAVDIFIYALFAFLIIRIISIIFSDFPASSNQSFYKEALFYFSFISFNYYLKAFDKKKIKNLTVIFVIAASVIALIGIIRFDLNFVTRAQSFGSGYSTFSSYLLTGLAMILFLPDKDEKINWTYSGIGIALLFTGIITSLGRTNLAIAVLIFAVGIFVSKSKVKTVTLAIFVAAFLSFISFSLNDSGISERVEKPTQFSDRDIIYKGAIEILWEKPIIGFGPRTFHDIFPRKQDFADKGIGSWHNDFLQIYFESGFLGLAAFLFLIGVVIIKALKFIKNFPRDDLKMIVWGSLFGVVALVLSALTAGFINSPILSILFGFLASLIAGTIFKKKEELNEI